VKTSRALVIVTTCGLLSAVGCGNPCLKGRAKTDQALREAREAQAPSLAPEAMARAVELAESAERECVAQSSRWFFARSFRQAEELSSEALREAEGARERARARGGLLRQEALNSRYTAGMAVSDVIIALRRAREMKGNARAQALLGRLEGLRLALADLQREIDAARYSEASQLGERIRSEALRLQADANTEALSPGSR